MTTLRNTWASYTISLFSLLLMLLWPSLILAQDIASIPLQGPIDQHSWPKEGQIVSATQFENWNNNSNTKNSSAAKSTITATVTAPKPSPVASAAPVVSTNAKPPVTHTTIVPVTQSAMAHPAATAPTVTTNTQATPVITVNNDASSLRKIVVVIDPGHGGKDPGATGINGTHEKDVVLSICKKLQTLINQKAGFSAKLTRTGDYFIPLRERLTIARTDKADMFVAVHADAYMDHVAEGASVYALSQRGATSEAALWLAQRENQSELMGGVDLADKENVLRSVLINLSQTATIHASLLIGQNLLAGLHQFTQLHYSRVEQAAFVVLKSPDIPSLLVETGFLSNPVEEKNLNNPLYQQKIAQAMMLGITHYFEQNPPPDTWLAARLFPQDNQTASTSANHSDVSRYVVQNGDTLSSIALSKNISMNSLRTLNHLHNDSIYKGQKLILSE